MELYHPNVFLELAPLAEKAGFDTIWASDHFHPWQDTDASSASLGRGLQRLRRE
jgi:alkanesulfonate monooxygenase SsuD/methylene tetrahydromethanopterin reductase-like flavin-dependent oxidoreductase (luciferase family)